AAFAGDDSGGALAGNDGGRGRQYERLIDQRATLGELGLVRPVAPLQQLVDGLLAEMIDLADRQEQARRQSRELERRQREGCFAESSGVLGQRPPVESPLRCG